MGSQSDTDTTSNDSLSFIEISPIGEDQLEGKAQENIAKSIAQLIKKNKIKNKLIGLDGAWGSGKSNLIEILKKKLSKEYHFFIYDAWGHQEDLQRRSFLEELEEHIDHLFECKIIVSKWKKKLKALLSIKIKTETKTTHKIEYGLFTAILSALSIMIYDTIPITTNGWGLKILIFLGLAFFVGLTAYFFTYRDKTYVTISEKEPSVKEFQKYMTDLSKALTKKDKKKLVVVFDNMDRLPSDKIRKLWSLIHTFFAEDVFESIWIIVPFDRNHIAAAFEGKSAASKNKDKISEDFLNKSFSVIYRVAPPVLTDWKQFFDLKFKKAFGESEQQEELDCVRKIFGQCIEKEITPRNIIAFINEIVSLRQISETEIRLRGMAVFVLNKKDILPKPVDAILGRKYLNSVKDIFATDNDLPNHIASLVYQVPLERASQVMLTPKILDALNSPDSEKLTELANYPNFTYILEDVISENDLNINNAVSVLIGLAEQYPNILSTALVEHLVKKIMSMDEFDGKMYYETLSNLDKCVQKKKPEINMLAMVQTIEKSPDIFVDYVTEAQEAQDDYKKFKLKCDKEELHKYIIEKTPNNLAGLAVLSVISDDDDYDLVPIVEHLKKDEVIDSLSLGNIGSFYEFYRAIAKEKPIKAIKPEQLERLFRTVQRQSEDLPELLAMILADPVSWDINDLIKKIEDSLNKTDEDTVKNIINRTAERIEYYKNYGTLLLNYLAQRQSTLKAVLNEIPIDPPYEDSTFDSNEMLKILKKYSYFDTLLGVTHKHFLKRLSNRTRNTIKSITIKNILDLTDDVLFQDAFEVNCSLSIHLLETMIEKLDSLNLDEWNAAIGREQIYKVTNLFIKNLNKDGPSHFKDIVRRKLEVPANKDSSPFAKEIGVRIKRSE